MDKKEIEELRKKQEDAVKNYLDEYAKKDAVFAEKYKKGNKTIKGAYSYAKNQVKELAMNGYAMVEDEIVFGWLVHYFDEEELNCEEKPKATPTATAKTTAKAEQKKSSDTNDLFSQTNAQVKIVKLDTSKKTEKKKKEEKKHEFIQLSLF